MAKKPVVAAFDFDGTLTYRDSLLYFLHFVFGSRTTTFNLLKELPHLAAFQTGLISRQTVKEHVLTRFLGGQDITSLQDQGRIFAQKHMAQLLKPEGLKRVQWHLNQEHRCILISANLDLYLKPWAKLNGFHDAVTSICAVNDQGKLTGKLEGLNCWGQEKVDCLTALLGARDQYTLYAYGDSLGDKPLLAAADFPFYRPFS